MAYTIVMTAPADRAVAKLPRELRRRIADRLAMLAENPRPPGAIKLTGENAYRIRVGDYRIIYAIEDRQLLVLIVDVGHRRDVYRRR